MSQEHSKEEMEKVIARVQKILALSKTERGSSEAEADTALRLAQDLMAKYNLDMAVIEAATTAKDTPTIERIKEEFKGRAMYKWQRQLAKYVAEANFCYHLIQSKSTWIPGRDDPEKGWIQGRYKTEQKHIFVGRRANVITAQLMYQYLTQTIEDLLPIKDNALRLSRSAMSWKEGCADRLCERLAEKRRDLFDEHDAKMRAAQAAAKAESDAKYKVQPKQLSPNKASAVRDAMEGIAAEARVAGAPDAPEEADRPEPKEGDTWSPADAEKAQDVPPTSTALVLASVFDSSEREANYEAAYGLEPGTLAKRRAEREEERRLEAEEEAKRAMEDVEKPVKEETERQRAARERREAEAAMKQRRKWAREDDAAARREAREWAKKDHRMYYQGAEAGKSIGIDTQVGAGTAPKQLGPKKG